MKIHNNEEELNQRRSAQALQLGLSLAELRALSVGKSCPNYGTAELRNCSTQDVSEVDSLLYSTSATSIAVRRFLRDARKLKPKLRLPTYHQMTKTKHKIKKVIRSTNGLPNFTQKEYLKYIRAYLSDQLSHNEIEMIRREGIDLNCWILEITREITSEIY